MNFHLIYRNDFLYYLSLIQMPARKKKSTVKTKKGKSGISISIKNVMKQVMNERPQRQRQRTDFIMPQGKDPRHNLNTGSMTRMFAPAITYASAPLSAFPSLASLASISSGGKQTQLNAHSDQPLGAPPLVAPRDIKNDDLMVPVQRTARAAKSEPVVTPPRPSRPINLVQVEFNGVDTPESNRNLFAPRVSLLEAQLDDQLRQSYGPRYNQRDLFRGNANDELEAMLGPDWTDPFSPGFSEASSEPPIKTRQPRAAASDRP